ncbi:hypothetical protein [Neolewinella xylanilytica]|uniref:hypothetical protein n=1 Tax=Neolewinella xylanilytica TaxID=1514080 RepID=UPI000CEAF9DE|nr:hypothetical protein [Neolewinella xylanilytica]
MLTPTSLTEMGGLPPVFHLYNRANDRKTLFTEHGQYQYFLGKVRSNLATAAHLLGYCIMPNHFHLLLTPTDPLDVILKFDDKVMSRLPTDAISEAIRRILMGFT